MKGSRHARDPVCLHPLRERVLSIRRCTRRRALRHIASTDMECTGCRLAGHTVCSVRALAPCGWEARAS